MATIANIYRNSGAWCYASFVDGEYDHSDTIDADSEAEARAEIATLLPGAEVRRVADTQEPAVSAIESGAS
jgi:hypothetical protein